MGIAEYQLGDADVVADEAPNRIVAAALVENLEGTQYEAFRIRVRAHDHTDASGLARTDVQVMRRGYRKADQLTGVKYGQTESDVGAVRCTIIGIVVHDNVARLEGVAATLEFFDDSSDITRYRTRLQRRALRAFAKLTAGGIADRCAEILGFSNDAGVGHAHELVAHFDGNVLERTLNDAGRHRVDSCRLPIHIGFDSIHFSSPL